jgi:hypothetical protein
MLVWRSLSPPLNIASSYFFLSVLGVLADIATKSTLRVGGLSFSMGAFALLLFFERGAAFDTSDDTLRLFVAFFATFEEVGPGAEDRDFLLILAPFPPVERDSLLLLLDAVDFLQDADADAFSATNAPELASLAVFDVI